MPENLRDHATVQYGDFKGTTAGDVTDFGGFVPEVLGVDKDQWQVLVVDLACYGGTQFLKVWAIGREEGGWDNLEAMIAEKGRVEVTCVVDRSERLADHADSNPPAKPADSSFGLVGDVLVYGFKRLEIRMISRNIPDERCPIVEVASIVEHE